ncbi:hypothetical protein PV326_011964, partial [Microctonus aethiopoides]
MNTKKEEGAKKNEEGGTASGGGGPMLVPPVAQGGSSSGRQVGDPGARTQQNSMSGTATALWPIVPAHTHSSGNQQSQIPPPLAVTPAPAHNQAVQDGGNVSEVFHADEFHKCPEDVSTGMSCTRYFLEVAQGVMSQRPQEPPLPLQQELIMPRHTK